MKGKKNYKLIELMEARGSNQTILAPQLGISYPSLQQKVAGIREFKANEIAKIKELFQLSDEEVAEIFFKD